MSRKSNKTTARERRLQRRRKEKQKSNLVWLAGGGIALVLIAFLVWNSLFRTPIGEEIGSTGAGVHLARGQPLPIYSSNPPTSGPHYESTLGSGFYDENDPMAASFQNAAGFIIHSMEHGYVVFWYNCSILSPESCSDLKANLAAKIEEENSYKIIAFPWTSIDRPLAMTSWGYLLEMDSWDEEMVDTFISRNRNNAPESAAPNSMKGQ